MIQNNGSAAQVADTPFFSLILATVDRSQELQAVIDSLIRQSSRDFELIVVDQNPDDRVVAPLQPARDAGIVVHHLRAAKRGLAHARNVGLDRARGHVVAFPDDDCWYEPDVLAQVRQAMQADPSYGGIVCRWAELEDYLGIRRSREALDFEAFRNFRGGRASSISLFFRRDIVEKVGRFDARLGVGAWYGASEETDLVMRILGSGTHLEYIPSIVVHHKFPPAAAGKLTLAGCRSNRRRARGIGALYAKHRLPGWVVFRGLVSPIVGALLSKSPFAGLVKGFYETLGRAEGLLRWKFKES
jgi:glycosyltransferase involved in cell wall biosynthesis